MGDSFLDPILERVARAQTAGMRIGTLTAIDAPNASVTVSLGNPVPGVRWVGSYTPTVGDMVVVSRVDEMWVVLGKLSKQFGAPSVRYDAYTLLPSPVWRWSSGRGWSLANAYGYVEQKGQGGSPLSVGMILYWGMNVPVGATVTSARLNLVRGHPVFDAGAPLVSPVIYGTAQSGFGTPTPAWPPSMVAGYGPWRPGTLAHEQGATWDLPSAWFTALAAGTLTGFVFYATELADEMTIYTGPDAPLSGSLQINYSIPA